MPSQLEPAIPALRAVRVVHGVVLGVSYSSDRSRCCNAGRRAPPQAGLLYVTSDITAQPQVDGTASLVVPLIPAVFNALV